MKNFYMIWRDGNYPPSKKHDAYEEVAEEMVRLCKKHPEEHFYILKCVTVGIGMVDVKKVDLESNL